MVQLRGNGELAPRDNALNVRLKARFRPRVPCTLRLYGLYLITRPPTATPRLSTVFTLPRLNCLILNASSPPHDRPLESSVRPITLVQFDSRPRALSAVKNRGPTTILIGRVNVLTLPPRFPQPTFAPLLAVVLIVVSTAAGTPTKGTLCPKAAVVNLLTLYIILLLRPTSSERCEVDRPTSLLYTRARALTPPPRLLGLTLTTTGPRELTRSRGR